MKCPVCSNGDTSAGTTTVVLERNGTTLIYKNVPAEICDNCGEEFVTAKVNDSLLKSANEAAEKGVEIEMLKFAA